MKVTSNYGFTNSYIKGNYLSNGWRNRVLLGEMHSNYAFIQESPDPMEFEDTSTYTFEGVTYD